MKVSFISILILVLASFSYSSCEKSSEIKDLDIPIVLTDQEKSDLIFMREEEKLARDVYIYLYDKYDMNIFHKFRNFQI